MNQRAICQWSRKRQKTKKSVRTKFKLSKEEEDTIQSIFNSSLSASYKIAANQSDSVCKRSFDRLRPGTWLNDEVINFYCKILVNEVQKQGEKIHYFNSHFFSKLYSDKGYCYENVKRWSRHIPGRNIFELDKVFVPINVQNQHWILAVLFPQDQKIQIYDAMNGDWFIYLDTLNQYLKDEYHNKHSQSHMWHGWQLIGNQDGTPQQQNSYDCGVFVCMYVDYLASNKELLFNQDDVNLYRNIITSKIAMLEQ